MTIILSGCKGAGRTECTTAESRVPRASGCTSTANHQGRSGSPTPAPRDTGRDRPAVAVRPRTEGSRRSVQRFQDFDARREDEDWPCPGFQDEDWAKVRTVEHDDVRLSPEAPATAAAQLPP